MPTFAISEREEAITSRIVLLRPGLPTTKQMSMNGHLRYKSAPKPITQHHRHLLYNSIIPGLFQQVLKSEETGRAANWQPRV